MFRYWLSSVELDTCSTPCSRVQYRRCTWQSFQLFYGYVSRIAFCDERNLLALRSVLWLCFCYPFRVRWEPEYCGWDKQNAEVQYQICSHMKKFHLKYRHVLSYRQLSGFSFRSQFCIWAPKVCLIPSLDDKLFFWI